MKIAPLASCAALAACAALPGADEAPASLAQAESAFAAHSVREDMRVAFLAHFAPGGLLVRNAWITAREALESRPAPPITLDWRPQYVEVAASGDMGLSTGPWRITSRVKPDAPPTHGQFVSVWKREPGQPWRVHVDTGISNEGPALWDAPLVARRSRTAAAVGSLADAEAAFSRASLSDAAAAYRAHGAADLRFYRAGDAPRATREAALATRWLAAHPKLAWTTDTSEVAGSGDFGYARGSVTVPGAPAPAGWYLRVWRREAQGWRIVMDVVTAPSP